MKPGHIRRIETGNVVGMDTFTQEVIFGEHFTHEAIRQIALGISVEILRARGFGVQPSMQEHLILSLLEPSRIYAMIKVTDAKEAEILQTVSEEELKKFIETVRAAIIENIIKTLDLEGPMFHFVSKKHTEKNTIIFLENGTVHKDFRFDDINTVVESNNVALKKLYAMKERSPHILYGLLHKDAESGDEIQSYANIETLESYMDHSVRTSPDFRIHNPIPAFYALRDALRGAKFLSDNGIILSDMSPDNIGIDSAANAGYLFDLDGLMPAGERTQYYPGKENYYPPELYEQETIVNEKFSVYELGVTLFELIYWYQDNTDTRIDAITDVMESFKRLGSAMQEQNPDHRITLEAAEMKYSDLCEKLKAAVNEAARA